MNAAAPLNVLLVGGSGFLSGALARLAVAEGHQVWALTRGQRSLPAGVTGLTADRRDPPAFEQAVRAAGVHWDIAVDCIAYEPADVLQDVAVLRERVGQLVFVSTDFVYDPANRRFPQPEEPAAYIQEGYGGKKRQAELALIGSDCRPMTWTIVRPCHIYGPGSQPGCLPAHGRDPQLLQRLMNGEALRLVGGGHFLQQPIFARDLAATVLSFAGNPRAAGQVFNAAGPGFVESRAYYRIIAEILGVALKVEEIPVSAFQAEHPEAASFLCHRIYDLSRLRACGCVVPSTPLEDGLREHILSMGAVA